MVSAILEFVELSNGAPLNIIGGIRMAANTPGLHVHKDRHSAAQPMKAAGQFALLYGLAAYAVPRRRIVHTHLIIVPHDRTVRFLTRVRNQHLVQLEVARPPIGRGLPRWSVDASPLEGQSSPDVTQPDAPTFRFVAVEPESFEPPPTLRTSMLVRRVIVPMDQH